MLRRGTGGRRAIVVTAPDEGIPHEESAGPV
jgi:hypothetical protein